MSRLRWGILATGNIARQFAKGVQGSNTGSLQAVASRSLENAQRFASELSIPDLHDSYSQLLENPKVDAVYIATPHPSHPEWAIKTAEAGKHVLCEKPVGLNENDARHAIEAAKRHGVVFMEAYMYRCHPQTAKLVELIRSGAIGAIRSIQAAFCFKVPFDPTARHFSKELGGGGILDVGGYTTTFARLIAGAACGKAFASPNQVQAMGYLIPETGVDGYAVANLQFENQIFAQIACGVYHAQQSYARIFGESGWIEIINPWNIAQEGGDWSFMLNRPERSPETISGSDPRPLYGIEADHFAALVAGSDTEAPGMPNDDTLDNMRVMDEWRRRIGLKYDSE